MMFYLAKFCRICIKTNVELIDIESDDEGSLQLKQKLEECTEIVISKHSLSTKICKQCVEKLKVSYDFHEMCKKSSKLLQGILELVNDSDKITSQNLTSTELRVTLLPLKSAQDEAIERTSNQGSSILKSLLSCKDVSKKSFSGNTISFDTKGGLRNIIAFTRSFNFGDFDTNESSISKLVRFSEGFFKRDFSAFQKTVLYIIENENALDDEDDMFEKHPDELKEIKFEEVVIEPDIRVKTEIMESEEVLENSCDDILENDIHVKKEYDIEEQDCLENLQIYTRIPYIENFRYLDKLYAHRRFSQTSIRCRTRGNPYINPQLKKQFMLRSFQCKSCPRYFKTPGYLKAHCAKVHNGPH